MSKVKNHLGVDLGSAFNFQPSSKKTKTAKQGDDSSSLSLKSPTTTTRIYNIPVSKKQNHYQITSVDPIQREPSSETYATQVRLQQSKPNSYALVQIIANIKLQSDDLKNQPDAQQSLVSAAFQELGTRLSTQA